MTAAAEVRDLGVMDGPVLVFGGPYGNLEATAALLAEARTLGIRPSQIICTGDVAAYCADPQATVDLIRDAGIAVVMGNCEESLAAGASDCGCGFAEGTVCWTLSEAWYAYSAAALDRDAKAWMGALPRRITFLLGGRRLAAIHGGVRRINRFVFASTPDADKIQEIKLAAAEGIVGGHCGLPFTQVLGRSLWHNPGAIGLPANDGTPRTWYAVLAPAPGGISITHRALAYDHDAAARKMEKRGLPLGYAKALRDGRWPSLEVLPAAERAATGVALAPLPVLWSS